jgi:Xaa-Pro aminopeptidase
MTEGFDVAELRARRAAAQRAMADRGMDAIWIGTEANFVYFTGVATPSFASRTRPISLLLPANGEPVVVIARSHVAHIERTTSVTDVRGFNGFESAAIDTLVEAIRDLGLDHGRIGLEQGEELRLPVSLVGLADVQRRLPDVTWVDVAPLVWELRKVKSAAEIEVLKGVGRITGLAFDAMLAAIRPGISQRELYAVFGAEAARLGADRVGYFTIHHGTGSDRRSNASPSDAVLARGDMVWVDAGLIQRGYWSDFVRMAVVGDVSRERRAEYRFVHDVSRMLMDRIRPGTLSSEVMAWAEDAFRAAGRAVGNATRIGHGVGLDITEPPSIVGGDPTPLVAGMTLAIEPGTASDLGYFVVEENFVVGVEGTELLSAPAPAELPSVSGSRGS